MYVNKALHYDERKPVQILYNKCINILFTVYKHKHPNFNGETGKAFVRRNLFTDRKEEMETCSNIYVQRSNISQLSI